MLVIVGVALLSVWAVGVAGLVDGGRLVHVPLLVGLMLLLIAFVRARDAALGRTRTTSTRHDQ